MRWDMEAIRKKAEGFEHEQGVFFRAILFDDYVIKIPHARERTNFPASRLKMIAEAHTTLSRHIKGVLPAVATDQHIIMPRAPGIRSSRTGKDRKKMIVERIREIREEAKEYGYILKDIKVKDSFWEEEAETVWVVDFSNVRRIGERKGA